MPSCCEWRIATMQKVLTPHRKKTVKKTVSMSMPVILLLSYTASANVRLHRYCKPSRKPPVRAQKAQAPRTVRERPRNVTETVNVARKRGCTHFNQNAVVV